MNYRIYLLVILALTSCMNLDNDVSAIVNEYKEKNTISYLLKTKNKALFEQDTISTKYKVNIEKNVNDTVYGYNFKIKKLSNDYLVYHHDNMTYYIDSVNNRIATETKKKDFFKQIILPLFSIDLNDSIVSTQLMDDILFVKMDKGDFEEVNNVVWNYKFYLNKDQMLEKNLRLKFQNTSQFDSWEYYHINYSNIVSIKTEINNLKKDYKVISFSELKNNKMKDRAKFTGKAPNLTGLNLNLSNKFDLSKEKVNYILLDFWFMACHPCIKSYPFLNETHKTYDNKLLKVIGVNIKDYDESKFELLRGYISKNNIEYTIAMCEKNPFNVQSFPTVLLLDENREIVYSHIGYSKDNERKLDSILNDLLNTGFPKLN